MSKNVKFCQKSSKIIESIVKENKLVYDGNRQKLFNICIDFIIIFVL